MLIIFDELILDILVKCVSSSMLLISGIVGNDDDRLIFFYFCSSYGLGNARKTISTEVLLLIVLFFVSTIRDFIAGEISFSKTLLLLLLLLLDTSCLSSSIEFCVVVKISVSTNGLMILIVVELSFSIIMSFGSIGYSSISKNSSSSDDDNLSIGAQLSGKSLFVDVIEFGFGARKQIKIREKMAAEKCSTRGASATATNVLVFPSKTNAK